MTASGAVTNRSLIPVPVLLLLSASDWFFGNLPRIKKLAGVIVAEGVRQS
jgi:hypothetical protein